MLNEFINVFVLCVAFVLYCLETFLFLQTTDETLIIIQLESFHSNYLLLHKVIEVLLLKAISPKGPKLKFSLGYVNR